MSRPLTILVNLLHAQESLTGSGWYARHMLEALLRLPDGPRIVAVVSPLNKSAYRLEDLPAERLRTVVWGGVWRSVGLRRAEEWARMNGLIRREKPDVFWCPSNFLPLWKTGPMVVTIHDMTFFAHPEALPPVRRWYWHRWTRRTIRNADAIVTVSEASLRDIVRFGGADGARITVIPNGVARPFYAGGDESGRAARRETLRTRFPALPRQYLLFVGTLTPHKNVPRLIEAAGRARSRDCGDLEVVLAGKRGPQFERISEAIGAASMTPHVHELGYVGDDLLPALYENARLAALPSLSEGFGLPIVEAMACGTAVVTSNRGAMAEVAGDAALLADPESAESLAEAIARLWSDQALRDEMRERGIARAAEFSWDAAAAKLMRVFESVAAAAPRQI